MCPTCLGSGRVHEDSCWIDTLAHWSHRLSHDIGADTSSITDWSTLYVASPFRKEQAMEILHKLMKKGHGGPEHAVKNPSAFLVVAVKEAWWKKSP